MTGALTDVRVLRGAVGLAALAVAVGLVGGPVALRTLVLAAFVLVVPGVAALCWTRLDGVAAWVLLPCVGLAAVVVATASAALAGWWSPPMVLVALAVACGGSCVARLARTDSP